MSKIFNLGSLNLDHVYRVQRFVQPGETLFVDEYQRHLGGKGFNHSAAIAKAGTKVVHIGACPSSDLATFQAVATNNLEWHIQESVTPSGHAIIQVDAEGENQILLYPGANQELTLDHLRQLESGVRVPQAGDWFLTQNETNLVPEALAWAKEKGLSTAYAAAPFDPLAIKAVIDKIDVMALNTIEAEQLEASLQTSIESIGIPLVIITKGADGVSVWRHQENREFAAFHVDNVVDTTGAGDCFFGSFLAHFATNTHLANAIGFAQAAAALSVSKTGAAGSYADQQEVEAFLNGQD